MFLLVGMCIAAGRFRRNEEGEATVAWVLATAAGVALAIAVLSSVGGGAQEISEKMDSELSNFGVGTTF